MDSIERGPQEVLHACINIDLKKAFDSAKWEAIMATLEAYIASLSYSAELSGTVSLQHPFFS